jgi:hypothetical protein
MSAIEGVDLGRLYSVYAVHRPPLSSFFSRGGLRVGKSDITDLQSESSPNEQADASSF